MLNGVGVTEVSAEFQQFAATYRERGWQETIGSSGTILTLEMATAMNRSVANILFAGFGSPATGGGGDQEQRPYRRARHQRIDDHGNGRWNYRPKCGAGNHHSPREATCVARLFQHLFDRDQTRPCRIGNGAATHTRKNHADQNIHLGQTTPHSSDQNAAEVKNPLADRPRVHDVGREHKQRYS